MKIVDNVGTCVKALVEPLSVDDWEILVRNINRLHLSSNSKCHSIQQPESYYKLILGQALNSVSALLQHCGISCYRELTVCGKMPNLLTTRHLIIR